MIYLKYNVIDKITYVPNKILPALTHLILIITY